MFVLYICWQAFQESLCHCLQKYCLNYSTALLYLDSLKPREDFGSYVKVPGAANQRVRVSGRLTRELVRRQRRDL